MSADFEGNINIWDTNQNKPLGMVSHGDTQVWDAGWNNMGTVLATCGGDKLIKLWADQSLLEHGGGEGSLIASK